MVFKETLIGGNYAASSRDYDTWYILAFLPRRSNAGLGSLEPAIVI